jgi:inosine-uridine nucleoside N-ribohydrolase
LNQSSQPVAVFVSGPCTDLARALRLDPGIREHISAVYIMGGAVYVPGNLTDFSAYPDNVSAEWNIYIDPLAASEVFESGLPIVLVPLDATNQVRASMADTARWRQGGRVADFAADFYDMLLGGSSESEMSLWDVMTAVIMLHPDLCALTPLHLQVITEPGNTYGQTLALPDGLPNVQVCLDPHVDGIKQTLADVFAASR